MAKTLLQSQQQLKAAQEAEKQQKRNQLNAQIRNLNEQISAYDNQISSLESKLVSQKMVKSIFEEKGNDLDTEKAAKSVYTQNVSQYVNYQKFAYGYTEVMNDYTNGNTAQVYQNYRNETLQFMQSEIDENQRSLETVQRARNSSINARADLNIQLSRV